MWKPNVLSSWNKVIIITETDMIRSSEMYMFFSIK